MFIQEYPHMWTRNVRGEFAQRTLMGTIPFDQAKNWPVYVRFEIYLFYLTLPYLNCP